MTGRSRITRRRRRVSGSGTMGMSVPLGSRRNIGRSVMARRRARRRSVRCWSRGDRRRSIAVLSRWTRWRGVLRMRFRVWGQVWSGKFWNWDVSGTWLRRSRRGRRRYTMGVSREDTSRSVVVSVIRNRVCSIICLSSSVEGFDCCGVLTSFSGGRHPFGRCG